MKLSIIITLFLTFSMSYKVFGQTKALVTPTADSNTNSDKKLGNAERSESKALKYEEGDVTIDLKIESERLIKLSDKKSRIITPILVNRKNDASIQDYQKVFMLAKTSYLKGEYKESRRLSKEGLDKIENESINIAKQYEEKFNSYTEELNEKQSILKNQSDTYPISNSNLIPYLNKRSQESGTHFRKAEFLSKSSQNLDSIKFYQLSILELLNGIRKLNQEIHTSSRPKKEGESDQKVLLNIDYLPIEARKDYDEVRNLIHEFEEQKRTKERERIVALKTTKQSQTVENNNTEEKIKPEDSK